MLSEAKFKTLKSEINTCTREEIVWFKGYLSGLLEQSVSFSQTAVVEGVKVRPIIIYGTETGNSKKVASELLSFFRKNKIQAKSIDASQFAVDKIEKEDFIISIVSTQGEGELPGNAVGFFEQLSTNLPNLNKTRYAVLGLGDSSYPLFCKAGEDFDLLFERLGAQRALPLLKADTDYKELTNQWFDRLKDILQSVTHNSETPVKAIVEEAVSHKKLYQGVINQKVILNDKGSNKETYHIEISSDESISYEPGDAVGFYPRNDKQELRQIAGIFRVEERFLELQDKNIRGLSSRSLAKFSELLKTQVEEDRLDLLDLLKKYGGPDLHLLTLDEVLDLLHPIAPRLYSISSSADAHEGEVHITVGLDRFTSNGKQRKGLCSDFLSELPLKANVDFYIHKNKHFRLPAQDRDVIMIGPGTGIAPFRSFLAHRDATGTEGKNWLFFGEQHFVSDFYYQTEIQEWLATGVLTRLETAFSRDQKHKIYVQDRLRENADEIFNWLQSGAYLYICGQKNPMSTDVENTLLEIISSAQKIGIEEAKAYLESLELEGRYQKDVY